MNQKCTTEQIAEEVAVVAEKIYQEYMFKKESDEYIINTLALLSTIGTLLQHKNHPVVQKLVNSIGDFITITVASLEYKRNNEQPNTPK